MLKRRTFLASSLATAAMAALPGAAFGAIKKFARPRSAKNAEHSVVYRNEAEFSAWPYTMGFWESANGHLLQNFMRAKADYTDAKKISHDVIGAGGATLHSIRSTDRGRTWDAPIPYNFERNGEHDGTGESVAELGPIDYTSKDVFVWSSSTAFGAPESRPFVRVSKDAGKTWSRNYRLPLDGLPSGSANSSQMVRPDGRSLLFLTMISKDGWSRRPMVYGSVPDGSGWHFMSFITPKEDPYGAADGDWKSTFRFGGHRWFYPRGYMLPSGRILCTLRSQRDPTGVMWTELYYSDDGAETWHFLSRINDFGAPGSLVLMKDGRLVCVYGFRLPPFGVRACVSENEGQTWGAEIVLRDDGGSWDLGYPNAIEAEPGKIMALYYFNRKDDRIQANGGVRHIARTIFTVD
jgi:hypothetical protein